VSYYHYLDQLNINELADVDSNDDEEMILPDDSNLEITKRREQTNSVSRSPLQDKPIETNSDDDF
jgi:hypothetical protein